MKYVIAEDPAALKFLDAIQLVTSQVRVMRAVVVETSDTNWDLVLQQVLKMRESEPEPEPEKELKITQGPVEERAEVLAAEMRSMEGYQKCAKCGAMFKPSSGKQKFCNNVDCRRARAAEWVKKAAERSKAGESIATDPLAGKTTTGAE